MADTASASVEPPTAADKAATGAAIGRIVSEMDPCDAARLLGHVPPPQRAAALEGMPAPEMQGITSRWLKQAVAKCGALEAMSAVGKAGALGDMSPEERHAVLGRMGPTELAEVRLLFGTGGHMKNNGILTVF